MREETAKEGTPVVAPYVPKLPFPPMPKPNLERKEILKEKTPLVAPVKPKLPFPHEQKPSQDTQFSKFLEVLKQLHINIPLIDAIEQMPSYAKFLKEILTRKRRLEECQTVDLTEDCSASLLNQLPQELKDSGSLIDHI